MTLQYAVATGFAMVLLVLIANVLMGLYVRAAVRDALDDGVRAAVPINADVRACQTRVDDAVAALVQGSFRQGVAVQCSIANGVAEAVATVRVPSFLPMLFGGWKFNLRASAHQEVP